MSIANGKIEVGDIVRVRYPPELRESLGWKYEVKDIKLINQQDNPFWTLEEVFTQQLIIIDFPIILEVIS